jgi:hypothetical protein
MFTPIHVPSAPYTCAVYMAHDAAKPHQQCPCIAMLEWSLTCRNASVGMQRAGGAADRLRAFPMPPAYRYT